MNLSIVIFCRSLNQSFLPNASLQEQDGMFANYLFPVFLAEKKKVYRVVHCLVAVGKCFGVEHADGAIVMPHGYDSLYVHDAAAQDQSVKSHRYVLFDAARIVPTGLVYFEYDPQGDELLKMQKASLPFAANPNDKIVNEAYAQAILSLESKTEHDAIPLEQNQVLQQRLKSIEDKRKEICDNAVACEAKLKLAFREAMRQLHDMTQLKVI